MLGGCEQLIAGTTVQCTWDGGENQCTTCPAGSACQSSNTIDPPPCAMGYECPDGTNANACDAGEYGPGGAPSCLNCPNGTICPAIGWKTPQACPAATYSGEGAIACVSCPEGHQARSMQTCFTHRSVSTRDRVPFQLTGEHFLYDSVSDCEHGVADRVHGGILRGGVRDELQRVRRRTEQRTRERGVLHVPRRDGVRDDGDGDAADLRGGVLLRRRQRVVLRVRAGDVPRHAAVGELRRVPGGDAVPAQRDQQPRELLLQRGDVLAVDVKRERVHRVAVRPRGDDAAADALGDGRHGVQRVPGRVHVPRARAVAGAVRGGDVSVGEQLHPLRGVHRRELVRDAERLADGVRGRDVSARGTGRMHDVHRGVPLPVHGPGRHVAV